MEDYTMSYGVYIGYRIESQESHDLSNLNLVRNPAD